VQGLSSQYAFNFFMAIPHAPLMGLLELFRYGYSYVEPLVQRPPRSATPLCVANHNGLDATLRIGSRRFSRRLRNLRDLLDFYGQNATV